MSMTTKYSAECPECKETVTVEFELGYYLGSKGGKHYVYLAKCPKCGHKAEIWGITKIRAVDGFRYETESKVMG